MNPPFHCNSFRLSKIHHTLKHILQSGGGCQEPHSVQILAYAPAYLRFSIQLRTGCPQAALDLSVMHPLSQTAPTNRRSPPQNLSGSQHLICLFCSAFQLSRQHFGRCNIEFGVCQRSCRLGLIAGSAVMSFSGGCADTNSLLKMRSRPRHDEGFFELTHAEALCASSPLRVSGLRLTSAIGDQFRVVPVHRLGFLRFASS